MKISKYITISEIEKIKLSPDSTYRYFKKFVDLNIVRRIESGKAR